jgi:hypothetical protein
MAARTVNLRMIGVFGQGMRVHHRAVFIGQRGARRSCCNQFLDGMARLAHGFRIDGRLLERRRDGISRRCSSVRGFERARIRMTLHALLICMLRSQARSIGLTLSLLAVTCRTVSLSGPRHRDGRLLCAGAFLGRCLRAIGLLRAARRKRRHCQDRRKGHDSPCQTRAKTRCLPHCIPFPLVSGSAFASLFALHDRRAPRAAFRRQSQPSPRSRPRRAPFARRRVANAAIDFSRCRR